MSNSNFTHQTPEIYDLLYAEKDYQSEANAIKKVLLNNFNIKPVCIEVGAGTGKLLGIIKCLFSEYIAIEPSTLFFNHLTDNFKSVTTINCSFEDYVKSEDFRKFETPIFLLANFNVFNYIPYRNFLNHLQEIISFMPKDSMILFDTWSQSYVKNRPSNQTSSKVINSEISAVNNYFHSTFDSIARIGHSTYNSSNNMLEISFCFKGQKSDHNSTNLFSEIHCIYPYPLDHLINEIEINNNCQLINCVSYENQVNNLISENSFDTIRNWFFTIKIL